jgi:hypothetical protein
MTQIYYIWDGDELLGYTFSQDEADIAYEAGYFVTSPGVK